MKIGAVYPQPELNGDPAALREFVLSVESIGYDYVLMYDHVVGISHGDRESSLAFHYNETTPFHEPLAAFSYLSGITSRIEFMTGVLVLPQRQLPLVAKQAADVDLYSGGRLRLGVGVGWNQPEFEAMGQRYEDRGARLTEQIPLLRRLWTEDLVEFSGDFHRIDRAAIMPRPRRRIPIYCGGTSEPAFRRAARLADGFIFNLGPDGQGMVAWTRLRELLAMHGRLPAEFDAYFLLQARCREVFDLDDIAAILPDLGEVGAAGVSIVTMDRDFTAVGQHIDFLASAYEIARPWRG